jgi:HSP20 family protein
MAIVRFDPFRSFTGLTRRFSDLFEDFEKGVNIEYGGFAPKVDISEDEKNIFINVELPGIRKEDVKVTVNDDNVLTIKGTKKREETVEDKEGDRTFVRVERSFGEFSRSFILPDNVKSDKIDAKYENGVLNLTLEKVEPKKPKEIEIKF